MGTEDKYALGMIGLGTMGRNLLLNMADHGFAVAGYDKDPSKLILLENEGAGKPVKAFLESKFSGGEKYVRRLNKIIDLEK